MIRDDIWPEERVAEFRKLWDEGHPTAEIGRRLGVSKSAVCGKGRRLRLTARPSPIRPAGSAVPRPVRHMQGPTLATLPSLAKPAWNALPEPEPATRERIVRLLTAGTTNADTAAAVGLSVDQVRKVRKTVQIEPRRRPIDEPKVYSEDDMAFWKRNRVHHREVHIQPTSFAEKFTFGKRLDVRRPAGKFPSEAEIAAHIASNGVKKCPAAAVAWTTGAISTEDRAAVAAYQQDRIDEGLARAIEYGRKGAEASKRAKWLRT